MQVVR